MKGSVRSYAARFRRPMLCVNSRFAPQFTAVAGGSPQCMQFDVPACVAYTAGMQYTLRRIPRDLDKALRQRARKEGRSLNEIAIEDTVARRRDRRGSPSGITIWILPSAPGWRTRNSTRRSADQQANRSGRVEMNLLLDTNRYTDFVRGDPAAVATGSGRVESFHSVYRFGRVTGGIRRPVRGSERTRRC